MKELKDIINQLEFVSYDDCTKELSASENALVIVGNVQKLKGSEDYIIVSPLNDYIRKFLFKIQDLERIEKIENQVFRVFIKVGSNCVVMTNGRTLKSNAGNMQRRRFDFAKMRFLSYRSSVSPCHVFCDSCVVGPCDSCVVGPPCDCDICVSCDNCVNCVCDCDVVT
jgi:hypothetical protein